jgi:uncharacterized protein YsxB (DUF464 family)
MASTLQLIILLINFIPYIYEKTMFLVLKNESVRDSNFEGLFVTYKVIILGYSTLVKLFTNSNMA